VVELLNVSKGEKNERFRCNVQNVNTLFLLVANLQAAAAAAAAAAA